MSATAGTNQLDVLESPAERRRAVLGTLIMFVGAGALGLVVGGMIVVVALHGLTPYERIVEALLSGESGMILFGGLALGILAIVAGFGRYRSMPTKRSRERAIAGGVLGIQAVVVAAILLAFRESGDGPERFVFHFLNIDFLEGYGGLFAWAAVNTLILAFVGQLGGMVLGLMLAFLALSKRKVVRAPARVYINFFRGTPLIWQLITFYFGFSLGLDIRPEIRLGIVDFGPAYTAAMIVFILNMGAYSSEVFRAGIQSIERGQMEAARSLGMSYPQAMRFAIVPQAVRRVIPPLLNEFVILIKDTSLVVVLGLAASEFELFTLAREGYSATANATFFSAAAVGYLAVTLPLIGAVNAVERRLRSGLVTVTS
jgi:His/Glu/Gln/Arg/opine family amino acid ABC transporter permease subunit